jgi:hypothetical protein
MASGGVHPFWIYCLPSPTVVPKKCTVNGTTQISTLKLYHTGTSTEDTHCQFYSEAFVLLSVSDGYTDVTITISQVLLPHLHELISPQEHDQIMHDEAKTHRKLAALETIAWRSSPAKQQSYIELRELLATMTSEEITTSQTTWVYALIIISIFLSFAVLTSRCWQRPFLTLIRKIFQWQTGQRPSTDMEMRRRTTPNTSATVPVTTDCPCCTEDPEELVGVTTSYAAIPLQMEAEAVARPAPEVQPKPTERVCFAKPGRFQLRKDE